MRLTLSIPTRGRPELLKYMMEQTLPNVALPDTTLLVCVDEDDLPTLDSIKNLPKDSRIQVSCRPREDTRGPKSDRALTDAPADLYLIGADYTPIITPAFDAAFLKAMQIWPDGIGVVYSQMCDELVPIFQAPTAKFVEKVGYIHNPDYPFWFIDHELADLAWMVGRINFCDVTGDPSKRPKTTHRHHDIDFWTTYFDFMAIERREIARRIIRDPEFQAPEWLKYQMCNWFPLLERRSEVRNAHVRRGSMVSVKDVVALLRHMLEIDPKDFQSIVGEQIKRLDKASARDDGTPDAGYLRAKAKAEQKASDLYDKINTALRAAA